MITEFIHSLWLTVTALAPSLALGLLLAGLLHIFVRKDRILTHLGQPGFRSNAKSALVGVPLPLCSCGVLPAALGLRKDGASRGAVTSFLISTPQTGVDSIAVTWSILGWHIAFTKVITAFFAGILGGTITDRLSNSDNERITTPSCTSVESGSIPGRIWKYSFIGLFRDIYKWLALGIVISAIITTLLEPGQLSQYEILNGPLGLLVALVIGIPLYVCSVSSVPIAAGLIYAGFPVGSALVFLMAGPATNAATMGAVRNTLGTKVFLVYILTVIVVSLVAGGILNSLNVSVSGSFISGHSMTSVKAYLSGAAGVLMLAGMLWFIFRDLFKRLRTIGRNGKSIEIIKLNVSGMHCSNCEARINDALMKIPDVINVKASNARGTVEISSDKKKGIDISIISQMIKDLGYKVKGKI